MGNLSAKTENGMLTLFLNGRIDSSNAPDVEDQIEQTRQNKAHTQLVLDLDALEYISSAGLRVILRLRKSEPDICAINASSEVYDILQMTGFTEILPVSKAYRKLSVDGCEVIGRGANGQVYRYDPETIVKVYFNTDALKEIKRERALARCAFVLGIPTAIPYDVVRVGDHYGSVFELLNAKPFSTLIADEPDKLSDYIHLYVELLKKIHETVVKPEDMPDQRDVVIDWAKFMVDFLPREKSEKLIRLVEDVPVDHHMLHGDYHIKNVMMQNGEVLLIDMDTLCQGHPVFELASIFNAYIGFYAVDQRSCRDFLGIDHELAVKIWKQMLPLYLDTQDAQRISGVEKKAMLIGYTRLLRRLIRRKQTDTVQGQKEYAFYRQQIMELLDQVDSLVF